VMSTGRPISDPPNGVIFGYAARPRICRCCAALATRLSESILAIVPPAPAKLGASEPTLRHPG
jgi:hypothetical protein